MNLKKLKKAELIEYIQELETRNQHTESKLADANYIIEHSETLDKDVVRLAQTAFDEKRQATLRADEATLRVEKAQELNAETIAYVDKIHAKAIADADKIYAKAIADADKIKAETIAKIAKFKAKDEALIAEAEATKAEATSLIAEGKALYNSSLNLYLKAKPEQAVSYLEKAYSLPSIDHK